MAWTPRDTRPAYRPAALQGAREAAATAVCLLEAGFRFPEVPAYAELRRVIHAVSDPVQRAAPRRPIPEAAELETPEERLHREHWERKLARTCPGCGRKTIGDDGRCTVCGAVKTPSKPLETGIGCPSTVGHDGHDRAESRGNRAVALAREASSQTSPACLVGMVVHRAGGAGVHGARSASSPVVVCFRRRRDGALSSRACTTRLVAQFSAIGTGRASSCARSAHQNVNGKA